MPDNLELWRLFGVTCDVRAILREIRDSARRDIWDSDFLGWELRIESDGQMLETELFRNRRLLDFKSKALYDQLVLQGWKPVQ